MYWDPMSSNIFLNRSVGLKSIETPPIYMRFESTIGNTTDNPMFDVLKTKLIYKFTNIWFCD